MSLIKQSILPAIRNFKDFEHLLHTSYEYLVLLNAHIAHVKPIIQKANEHHKKILIHMDLIEGLQSDEYATEFVAQEFQPEGIITTRINVISTAKKKGLITIQRLFLIDSKALENFYSQLEHKSVKPDFVEVLPGIIPHIIREIIDQTKIPVIAGGLIRSQEDVQQALNAGATAITTSRKNLW